MQDDRDVRGDQDVVPVPTRRQFFRRFAGDLLTSAAQITGAVAELRDRSAAEASDLFGELSPDASGSISTLLGRDAASSSPSSEVVVEPAADGARPVGFRTSFRMASDDVLLVVDQRRLPDALLEIPVGSAPEAARVIRESAVRGAPAVGQVAAIGLALTARTAARSNPTIRRAIIEGAANTLRASRPAAANLGWAVDRLMARWEAMGLMSEDGSALAGALMDEAMTIVAEATDDHGRLAERGLAVLPAPSDRPVEILTLGSTGPLAGGQYGTALGVVQTAHHAERPIHVWIAESRPSLEGARLTAWELAQAGVSHTLVPDGAAASLLAAGRVDAVLVGADRIAANGDAAGVVGTYPIAVVARRHGIPLYVVAPISSVDPATASGAAMPVDERPSAEVTQLRGVQIATKGTDVFNPAFDLTPAELITGIVTEEGVLGAPYEPSLGDAVGRRDARRRDARAAASQAATAGAPAPTEAAA
jgi:methylthioribose-1-phosphate isomerase